MSSVGGVKGFYKGKNIFITGGSGFLGICLLEKILRTIPDHGTIYLLLREKRGKSTEQRLEEIQKNPIFETLLKDKSVETVFSKVKIVAGDVGQDNLGLSDENRTLLTRNVNVIFHSAATLDFGETIKSTININLLGTRRIVQLAKECTNLNVFVHVSSAYVNAYKLQAEEVIYPLPYDPERLIESADTLKEEDLPEILGDHPNSYTITKHMAEHEVQKVESTVPCTIVRPSMILGAWKEPVPGWTMSKNGPAGFFMAASKGVLRRLPVATELIYDYVPVDVVVNTLLVAGFHAGVSNAKKVEVYHATSSTRNPFRWQTIENRINTMMKDYPLQSAVWFAYLRLLPSITQFKISAFFVHLIPAFFLDLLTKATGGRPILMKLHRNINTSLNRLSKFIFTEWLFDAKETEKLNDWLTSDDQTGYFIDLKPLVWIDFFTDVQIGSRVYLNKEPLTNLEKAKKKHQMLNIVNNLFAVFVFLLIWGLVALATGYLNSWVFVLPAYILFYTLV